MILVQFKVYIHGFSYFTTADAINDIRSANR